MKRNTPKENREITKQQKLLVMLLLGLAVSIALGLCLRGIQFGTVEKVTNLVFSEICTKNETIIADNDGIYRDYVELYNGGGDINLQGYCLTDGKTTSQPLGDMPVASGEYCLLFLDKELTGFSLKSGGGESIALISPAGSVVAQASTLTMSNDQVMLYANGEYIISQNATPGFSNNADGLKAFQKGSINENPSLLISEVLTENAACLPDEMGIFSDVIELYNSGERPIFLRNYCLSDSLDARFRYRLPAVTLEAGNYIIIHCDGENYISENGQIHANFGLTKGETLCLTGSDGSYIALDVQFPGENTALALDSEGKYVPMAPSLGYANDGAGAASFVQSRMDLSAELVVSEVLLSASQVPYQGSFTDAVEIWNRSKNEVDTAGWYLSDGSDPYAYALPLQKLKPDQRIVIQCSRGETGFALSRGENIYLLAPNGKWASQVPCNTDSPGQSIQLIDGAVYTAGAVSLGYENTPKGVLAYEKDRLPALQISELMSANASYLAGAYGKTADWIELYNGSKETVQLKDYCLSTDSGELGECVLPDKTLKPGQYCVILLAEREGSYLAGYSRLPINLSSNGETVYLSRNGEIVDYAILPAMPTDVSYGRDMGSGGFAGLLTPTPGSVNTGKAALSTVPQSSTAPGTYDTGSVDVVLSGTGTIHYTTDCTTPTENSPIYTGPIHLTQTTVIRAVSCEPGKLPSPSLDLTYVVNEGHSLPVVSLVTEPDNLWSEESGIYVEGPNASLEFPHKGANYWQEWERQATVSLFEKDGTGFSSSCGISIFGAYSRALSMKAFSIAFRDAYGAGSLQYPLFGQEGLSSYESFILRCSGQDFFKARMRDVLMTSLVADHTTVAVQKYRPAVLYLNGEFWGVYYIREKATENYVAGNHNVKVEDVLFARANGDSQPEYRALIDYVKNHDLSQQKHYDYVCSQIDVDNYIDYIVAEIYIANPDNGNIRFFKTPQGKWTWILYDTDYGFASASHDTVWEHLNPKGTGSNDAFSTKLINGLLQNPEFKEKFIRRIAWQINNLWTEENVNSRIDELEALIAQDMKRDCERRESSYGVWQSHVNSLRQFAASRNKQLPKFVQRYFDLSDAQMRDYGFDW